MKNQNFSYEENDKEGHDILNAISVADHFNVWMYQSIKPFLKGNILEIGSGIGNVTQFVVDDKFMITASDIREGYCNILDERFDQNPNVKEIRKIDIIHPNFDIEYLDLFENFDCIFALNIVEHIENEHLFFKNCRKLLKKNGNLIILVPAYKFLYNRFDKDLKHFRRYTKSHIEKLFLAADFQIMKSQYFNFIGIFGWWVNGSVLGKETITISQMKLYNKLVPIFKLIDKMLLNKAGLSVITFGKK